MNETILSSIEALRPALSTLFADIAQASRDGAGITRDAFGPRETHAAKLIAAFADSAGLHSGYDAGGNLHVAAAGRLDEAPEIIIASHLDSVPVGGNYDGLAGVIAGVAVLLAFKREDISLRRHVRVVGFRGEESPWFGTAYLGSKLLLGELTHNDLNALRRFDTGKTLADHIADLGIVLPKGKLEPTLSLTRLMAYLELHIEQGPILQNLGRPLGVAVAVRGNIRYPFAKCIGHYAHSAAVPRQFRRDALITSAKLVAFADDRWRALIEAGHDDLVFTCGIFHTDLSKHAMTKVPGEVTFSLNIGATKDEVMEDMRQSIMTRAEELARAHDVKFAFGQRVGTPAVNLDADLLAEVEHAGGEIGIAPLPMPTVGHDAVMFQRRGIPSSVLLIRNTNGSHNPEEHMEMADFEVGVKVLASTVYNLCQR